jgi:hypothetical protein
MQALRQAASEGSVFKHPDKHGPILPQEQKRQPSGAQNMLELRNFDLNLHVKGYFKKKLTSPNITSRIDFKALPWCRIPRQKHSVTVKCW